MPLPHDEPGCGGTGLAFFEGHTRRERHKRLQKRRLLPFTGSVAHLHAIERGDEILGRRQATNSECPVRIGAGHLHEA